MKETEITDSLISVYRDNDPSDLNFFFFWKLYFIYSLMVEKKNS